MRRRGGLNSIDEPIEVAASRMGAQEDASHGKGLSGVVSGLTSTRAIISVSMPKCFGDSPLNGMKLV